MGNFKIVIKDNHCVLVEEDIQTQTRATALPMEIVCSAETQAHIQAPEEQRAVVQKIIFYFPPHLKTEVECREWAQNFHSLIDAEIACVKDIKEKLGLIRPTVTIVMPVAPRAGSAIVQRAAPLVAAAAASSHPVVRRYVGKKERKRYLIAGDGNFSFARAFLEKHPKLAPLITVTEYASEEELRITHNASPEEGMYRNFSQNLEVIKKLGAKVIFNFDATKIPQRYHTIFFNFPYVAATEEERELEDTERWRAIQERTRKLVYDFFERAMRIQRSGDEIKMALPPSYKAWHQVVSYNILEVAKHFGYKVSEKHGVFFKDRKSPKYHGACHCISSSSGTTRTADNGRQFTFVKAMPHESLEDFPTKLVEDEDLDQHRCGVFEVLGGVTDDATSAYSAEDGAEPQAVSSMPMQLSEATSSSRSSLVVTLEGKYTKERIHREFACSKQLQQLLSTFFEVVNVAAGHGIVPAAEEGIKQTIKIVRESYAAVYGEVAKIDEQSRFHGAYKEGLDFVGGWNGVSGKEDIDSFMVRSRSYNGLYGVISKFSGEHNDFSFLLSRDVIIFIPEILNFVEVAIEMRKHLEGEMPPTTFKFKKLYYEGMHCIAKLRIKLSDDRRWMRFSESIKSYEELCGIKHQIDQLASGDKDVKLNASLNAEIKDIVGLIESFALEIDKLGITSIEEIKSRGYYLEHEDDELWDMFSGLSDMGIISSYSRLMIAMEVFDGYKYIAKDLAEQGCFDDQDYEPEEMQQDDAKGSSEGSVNTQPTAAEIMGTTGLFAQLNLMASPSSGQEALQP